MGPRRRSTSHGRSHEATVVTLPGSERYSAAGDQDALVAAIRDFIGVAPSGVASSRALRAVLFTDIVGSTETAFRLGVDEWKTLLEHHHALVRAELASFDGAEVDTAGDGFYATFEGPAAAVRCAEAVSRKVRELGIEIRAGVHVGECEVIDGHLGGPTAVDRRTGRRAGRPIGGPGLADREGSRRRVRTRVRGRRRARAEGRSRPLASLPGGARMKTPETRFAKAAEGVHIAYQVVGDGPVDLVWVMGWTSNVEAMWEEPGLARFLTKLSSFSRLILFDKRGVGLSTVCRKTSCPRWRRAWTTCEP